MLEIQSFTIYQYKKYLEAITKKTLSNYIVQAKIFRASMYIKDDFEDFVNHLQDLKEGKIVERFITEKGMQDMGIGKRKKIK